MIHRYVDLLEVTGGEAPGIVFLTRESSPSNQHVLYKVENLVSPQSPVKMTQTIVATGDGSDFLSDCELSPDGLDVIYCRHGVGSPAHSEIMKVDWDNTAATTLYSEPSGRNGILKPTWKPDGTKILFRSSGATTTLNQIKHMDPDGTNVATLHNGTNTIGDPLYSYDGTKIVFGENGALKVMNADGTGLSTIVASGASFPCWFRTQNVVAYIHTGASDGWRKINADGTGLTTLSTNFTFSDPSVIKWSVLSDDSAIVTTNFDGVDHDLVLIATDGSGITAVSPARTVPTATPDGRPVALFGRIYFPQASPYTELRSVAEDGSDFRLDFDGVALSPDVTFHGFKGDTLNV